MKILARVLKNKFPGILRKAQQQQQNLNTKQHTLSLQTGTGDEADRRCSTVGPWEVDQLNNELQQMILWREGNHPTLNYTLKICTPNIRSNRKS